MVENYLRATGFYHISRIGVIRGFLPLLAALVERWRTEIHTFVLPVGEVTVTLEDVAHIFGLPIDGELVSRWTDSSGDFLQSQSIAIFGREPSVSHSSKSYIKLGSTLFTDKSTAYAHAKYLPLLRDFERIHTYSWGSACLAHLYRALCRASRYDTKEMDGPLNLLLVWVRERMPCIAPVPRQTLPPTEIPVARRWSHSERTTAWLSKTVGTFRHDIDYMQEFEWRSYDGLIVPDELHRHLEVCDIVAPLLSFECVEWHPADRVMRHLGYVQPPLRAARDIPLDQHCIILCGVQLHDWTVLHGPWIAEWANRRHSRLRDLHPLPTWDFLPMSPAPQPPAPHGPPQHAVFESFPYHMAPSMSLVECQYPMSESNGIAPPGTLNALKKLLSMCLIQNIHHALGGCQSPPERFTVARIDSCRSEIIPTPSFLTTYIRRFLRKKCHASAVSPSTKAKAIGTMFWFPSCATATTSVPFVFYTLRLLIPVIQWSCFYLDN
ncbi:uncharacterized protein DS421_13g435970 [Arachis hypogaea]|nr:uncharacterized protein DS421_13g435970 [Arachis hypogaea]